MKLEHYNYPLPQKATPMQILFRSDDMDGLGEYTVCYCKVSLSFFFGPWHAHRSHYWIDFDDLYVIRHHSTQKCAFWVFVVITSHLGSKDSNFLPQKKEVNRHFLAKCAKLLKITYYRN